MEARRIARQPQGMPGLSVVLIGAWRGRWAAGRGDRGQVLQSPCPSKPRSVTRTGFFPAWREIRPGSDPCRQMCRPARLFSTAGGRQLGAAARVLRSDPPTAWRRQQRTGQAASRATAATMAATRGPAGVPQTSHPHARLGGQQSREACHSNRLSFEVVQLQRMQPVRAPLRT